MLGMQNLSEFLAPLAAGLPDSKCSHRLCHTQTFSSHYPLYIFSNGVWGFAPWLRKALPPHPKKSLLASWQSKQKKTGLCPVFCLANLFLRLFCLRLLLFPGGALGLPLCQLGVLQIIADHRPDDDGRPGQRDDAGELAVENGNPNRV